jgi:hypothetical protein
MDWFRSSMMMVPTTVVIGALTLMGYYYHSLDKSSKTITAKWDNIKDMLTSFTREFLGGLGIFIFGVMTYVILLKQLPMIEYTWIVAWIYHSMSIITLDNVTQQAILNPCVSVCFYVFGALDVFQLITQLLAHYYASTIGWSLMRQIIAILYSHDMNIMDTLNSALVGPSYALLSRNSHSYIPYSFGGISSSLFPITIPFVHIPGGLPTGKAKIIPRRHYFIMMVMMIVMMSILTSPSPLLSDLSIHIFLTFHLPSPSFIVSLF